MNDFLPEIKDRAILLGWIAGLVLIASLVWSFSFPFRSTLLMRSVNRSLAAAGDNRILAAPLLDSGAGQAPLGCWYRINNSGSLFFVFVMMRGGILVPCGAEIAEDGTVLEIVPLGVHARQTIARMPQGLIRIYIHRIEAAASRRGKA